jgi:hypothetical protein
MESNRLIWLKELPVQGGQDSYHVESSMCRLNNSVALVDHLDELTDIQRNRLNLLQLLPGPHHLPLQSLLLGSDEILLQLQKLKLFLKCLHFKKHLVLATLIDLHYNLGFINDQKG